MYHIPRESNTRVDLLSKLASTKKTRRLKTIIQEALQAPTIDTKEGMAEEKEEQIGGPRGCYHQTKMKPDTWKGMLFIMSSLTVNYSKEGWQHLCLNA